MTELFRRRLSRIKPLLQKLETGDSALLLSSAPTVIRSRDTFYPYRANSDFYYLTGITGSDVALLVSTKLSKPVLVIPRRDPVKVLWEGPPPNYKTIAAELGADLVVGKDPGSEILSRLKGIDTLFFNNERGSLAWKLAEGLIGQASHRRGDMPAGFRHVDTLLEQLRLKKDPHEVRLIERAAIITSAALADATELVRPGANEAEILSFLEYGFHKRGASVAFNSIVATGKGAATLHYEHGKKILREEDILLIDCGAEFEMYAGDLTRVMPVSGTYHPLQAELHEIVLASQKAAIRKIRHGVQIKVVYDAAAKVLTEGLVTLGVLRGKVSKLVERKAYRPYFPHGIGHSLGLDVHDVGKLRGNNAAVLEEGMVFTVEPGLYFPRGTKKLPPCGVRIEDDVLVTKTGSRILGGAFPKEVKLVERFLHGERSERSLAHLK